MNEIRFDVNSEAQRRKNQERENVINMIMSKQSRENVVNGDVVKNGQITEEEFKAWKTKVSYCGHCKRWAGM